MAESDPQGQFVALATERRVPLVFRALIAFGSVALIVLMILTCIDVVGRYFFRAPFPAAYELTTLAMGLLVFAGLPVITREGSHLNIDIVEGVARRIPLLGALCRWVSSLVLLGGLILLVIALTRQSINMTRYDTMTFYLKWPLAPFLIFMMIMTVLAVLAALLRLRRDLARS